MLLITLNYKTLKITSIRYINLKQNWHRRMMIKPLLKNLSFPIIRSPGVVFNFNDLGFQKYLTHGVEEYLVGTKEEKGVIGCWIAHLKTLESISERSGITVILEDDFVCTDNFFSKAIKMVNDFDYEFDVIAFDTRGDGPLEEQRIAENIYKPKKYFQKYSTGVQFGAQCLFINNSKIPLLIELLLNSKIQDYDCFLFSSHNINCFLFYTWLSNSRHLGSNIRSNSNFVMFFEIWRWVIRSYFKKNSELIDVRVYKGFYRLDDGSLINVISELNYLYIQFPGQPKLPISLSSIDNFIIKSLYKAKLNFKRNEKNEIIGVHYSHGNKNIYAPKFSNYRIFKFNPLLQQGYLGKYVNEEDVQITITKEYKFFAQLNNEPKFEILPITDNEFIFKDFDKKIIFNFDHTESLVEIDTEAAEMEKKYLKIKHP